MSTIPDPEHQARPLRETGAVSEKKRKLEEDIGIAECN
jgi:hypothetical protein